jgi:hypothetical protein
MLTFCFGVSQKSFIWLPIRTFSQNNAKFSAFQMKYPAYNCITAPLYPSKSANFVKTKVHFPFVAIEFSLSL